LNLHRGERIELIEKDDEFGDGWFVGKHLKTGETGLFPEIYTTPAAKLAAAAKPVKPQPAYPSPNSSTSFDPSPPSSSHGQSPPQYYSHSNQNSYSKRTSHAGSTRSVSLGPHVTNPVMNETLSVIEEHITDMNAAPSKAYQSHLDHEYTPPGRRLSYINGHETDEEDVSEFPEAEVRRWTPLQVAEHLESLGADRSHCEVFKDQEITGDLLMEMDKDTIMLKEFELGTLGKRLALLKKIQNFQQEVKGKGQPTPTQRQSISGSNRSSSTGAVLPKIPSVNEPQNYVNGARQRAQSTNENNTDPRRSHLSKPSVSSVHSLPHSRRHSSIDVSPNLDNQRKPREIPSLHVKQGSFDQTWSMVSPPNTMSSMMGSQPSTASGADFGLSPPMDSAFLSPQSPDYGTTATSAVDLDRGYFSSNENESRKVRNFLRKRDSGSHARAPSDGHSAMRLSGVFNRTPKNASSESVNDTTRHSFLSTRKRRSAAKTASLVIDDMSVLESLPKVDSPVDSFEKGSPSPATQPRTSKSKSRLFGLRAISDAVTGGEKNSAKDKSVTTTSSSWKSFATSSPTRPDSSAQSVTSTTQSASIDEKKPVPAKYVTFPTTEKIPKRKAKHETSAYLRGLEKKSPAEQIAESDYSGWMKKKSKKLGKWHSRLFVLRGCRLSYYYTEDDTEEKGLIDISYHRVLPANKDLITGFYATLTGATAGPVSPPGSSLETAAQIDITKHMGQEGSESGVFIFKLVPPRAGMSKAVNFTEPKVHFFAVGSVHEGRKWMAALMKATIEHDERKLVSSTYKEKTMSLGRARELRVRPTEFNGIEGVEEEAEEGEKTTGLGIRPVKEEEEATQDGVSTQATELDEEETATGAEAEASKDGGSDGWSLVNSVQERKSVEATAAATSTTPPATQ
jgi:hypothetical protein